ncbi:hypothetical protein BKA62DRAFT_717706 [Auriculariales sp. MPI-PUGE-AT-0066]|nr:hypothetical protein BKA62DRAFT_717706 [Auriculariales sp. MPI-PUGE-AT-0066]
MSSNDPSQALYSQIRAFLEREIPVGTPIDVIVAFSSRALQSAHAAFADHLQRCNSALRSIVNVLPAEMVVRICSMLSLADRITMCSISRAWRSFLLTAPTVWSDGDIGTSADLRWIAKHHQNTPLRLRSFIPLHEPGPMNPQVNGPRAAPTFIGPKYPNSHWMTYDLRSELAPYIQRWCILPNHSALQQVFQMLEFATGWPALEELDIRVSTYGRRPIVLPTNMAQRFPVLRTLHLPLCTISSDMMQMRSLEKLIATLHLESSGLIPQQIQLLQKLPSLRHLELMGVSEAVITALSTCKPPATLRILKLFGIPSSFSVPGRLERIEYSPLLRSEGWRSLKLENISLVAAALAGTAVNDFIMLVSSTTACDITLCVLAHGVQLAAISERDPAVSYGITQYKLPGISDPAERDTLSILAPMYAPTEHMLHPHIQLQQVHQMQLQTQLLQHPGQMHLQQHLSPTQHLSVPPTNAELFRRVFGEIADISPAVISRIARIELSGLALNALLTAQLSLPVVTILRLVITCERDGSAYFGNSKDPDPTVESPSARLCLPHLRTLHVECAQYLFAVPNHLSTTPQHIQPISNQNMTQPQVNQLQMHQLQMQATQARIRMMQAGYPSSAYSIPGARTRLTFRQLEERSRQRACVLERWFLRLLPGLVRDYGRALDTITVRLPSWKGFEVAAEQFGILFADLALNRAVVREPDGVLYEDPHSESPKAATFQT